MLGHPSARERILSWLREGEGVRLEELWREADRVRRRTVGDAVHLRGLIEISSHCVRQCGYCGLRAGNTALDRYRMTGEEILDCASASAAAPFTPAELAAARALHTRDYSPA